MKTGLEQQKNYKNNSEVNDFKETSQLASAQTTTQTQTHVAINTYTLTNKCHTNMHTHTLGDTHMLILWQHAYSKRVASCLRSVREQNTTCPLIYPSRAKRASLSNWSHLLLVSHPVLNGSLSAIFFFTIYPCLCCSFLSLLPHVWSQSTRFSCSYFKSLQGLFDYRVI